MAQSYDLTIDQGSTFSVLLELQDATSQSLNLSGITFASQARESYDSPSASFVFTCSVNNPASTGSLYMILPAPVTIGIIPGGYVYDLEMTTSGSIVSRIMEGRIVVTPEVTK